MPSSSPKVSVIIPSYCGELFVEQTIRSVLDQTFEEFELVVVDDGSTDGTRDILGRLSREDRRIRIVEKENEGLIATLNRAIAEAHGTFIARLDHDDLALPRRLQKQYGFLTENPEFIGCGCLIENIDSKGNVLNRVKEKPRVLRHLPQAFPPRQMWLYGPTPMIRADALRKVGGYRNAFIASEDRDLCWRLGAFGPLHMVPEILVQHRLHDGNMSYKKRFTQLHSAFLSDLSAVAAHFGRDDTPIREMITPGRNYEPVIAAYTDLLADSYPVQTYWYWFLKKMHAWDIAGFESEGELKSRIIRHFFERPTDPHRFKLVRRLVSDLVKPPSEDPSYRRSDTTQA